MNNARRDALLATMRKINKEQGQFMDFAENLDKTEVVNVGIPSIDKFVGGFKKGAFTVAWGGMSCFPENTNVLMEDYSWKPIQDIKAGDYVLGFPEKGFKMLKPTKVLKTFNRLTNQLVLIKTDKSEIITTPEHPFLAISGLLAKNNTSNRWITASQLREYNTKMSYFPNIKRDLEWKKGWLLGFIMTDGSITIPKSHSGKRMFVHCYNKNSIIRDKIIQYLKEVYSFDANYLIKKTGVFQITIGNSYFPSLISKQKEELYKNFEIFSEQFLRGFLAGYCDGDGTHNKKLNQSFRFHSTKKEQLELCQKILLKFNFHSVIRLNNLYKVKIIRGKQYTTKPCYVLEISSCLRFYLEFQQHLKGECYYNLTKQLSAQTVQWKCLRTFKKEFQVYNIETESHTYVANGFPVHNCGKSTLALQAIANAQKEGSICVYIDMERSFSKERAIQLGVNLQELVLISNCQTAEEALSIIRTLSKDKVCDFLVLDSIQAMSPKGEQENKGKERDLAEAEMAQLARTLSKFFRIVSPDVFKAKIAVLLIGQCRMSLGSFIVRADLSGGEALKHWSYQTIFMRRGQGADAPSQKVVEYFNDPDGRMHKESKNVACGFDAVLKLTKTKSASSAVENSEIHVPFTFEKGFVETVNFDEQIQITGTEEEKAIIRQKLVEKGVLKSEENIEPTLISPTIPIIKGEFPDELKNSVESSTAIEGVKVNLKVEPKKRGRKPKSNEKTK